MKWLCPTKPSALTFWCRGKMSWVWPFVCKCWQRWFILRQYFSGNVPAFPNIQCSQQTCLDQLSCPLGTGLVYFCSAPWHFCLPCIPLSICCLCSHTQTLKSVDVINSFWCSSSSLQSPLGTACCRRRAQDNHSRRPPSVWSASSPVGRARTASLGFDFTMAGLPHFSSVEKSDSPAIVKWAHVEIAVVCRAVNWLYCLCSKWQKDAGGYAVLPQVSVRPQPLCCANVIRHWAPFCFS